MKNCVLFLFSPSLIPVSNEKALLAPKAPKCDFLNFFNFSKSHVYLVIIWYFTDLYVYFLLWQEFNSLTTTNISDTHHSDTQTTSYSFFEIYYHFGQIPI